MTEYRDLLVEIGTEELPPRALVALSESLATGLCAGLADAGLDHGVVHPYATPRRLAVWIEDLGIKQPERLAERRGPALNTAFDQDGNATAAALGFARSCGVAVETLERLETDKGAWLVFRRAEPGLTTTALVPDLLRRVLDTLPVPKRMRWGSGDATFARPVRWAVLLFGTDIIDADVLGVRTGRTTQGHRFHHPQPLTLTQPADYPARLAAEGFVQPDFAVRRATIRDQATRVAAQAGGRALLDEGLLDEVTALVEWPVALVGSFDPRFLALPQEVLISTMQVHQKYFPVEDPAGGLLPRFVAISNLQSRDPAQVVAGNQRVIRPRLADAEFFWAQDRKRSLQARREPLRTVVFQHKLGSLYDKSERVAALAAAIAPRLDADPGEAARAAALAKCDLVTQMVGEFPELQGTMGRYYAIEDGEPEAVARAIDEQYMPRHAGDALPASPVGQTLALSDRLDTLVGIFAIGQRPTGDKDPFALRRAAVGILRLLIERHLDLDLVELLDQAAAGYGSTVGGAVAPEVFEFMLERLRAYYLEQGVTAEVFEAVLACRPTRPRDFDRRVRGVTHFLRLPEAASLAAANKRIRNILRQAGYTASASVDSGRIVATQEDDLHRTVKTLSVAVEPDIGRGDYARALTSLAGLKEPVDRFFDAVMVMDEDPALRANRLALLHTISALFLRIADISRLPG
ncbi:MAG: glycine--tRNA ligase subunit beta [Chromatiales bacterium 21-64-14]|nr:MAG: glycine--tRNA ligase subunit beta [Chromatiales bacterium 21-64-14]HQU14579.1 glycine--tRNA ligase subunit beta [Gammaproteobacteria bacterium]